jgi:hypothetical protein
LKCGTIAAAVAAVMDDATLTVTGYSHIYCLRELTQDFREDEIEAHRFMLQYGIMVEKAKH